MTGDAENRQSRETGNIMFKRRRKAKTQRNVLDTTIHKQT
jgi:hypothetical protein